MAQTTLHKMWLASRIRVVQNLEAWLELGQDFVYNICWSYGHASPYCG